MSRPPAADTLQVVIVGAGFGGIAAGVKLKAAGLHAFTIVERSADHALRAASQRT